MRSQRKQSNLIEAVKCREEYQSSVKLNDLIRKTSGYSTFTLVALNLLTTRNLAKSQQSIEPVTVEAEILQKKKNKSPKA